MLIWTAQLLTVPTNNHTGRSGEKLPAYDLHQDQSQLTDGNGKQSQHEELGHYPSIAKPPRAEASVGIVVPIAGIRSEVSASRWTWWRHGGRGLHGENATPASNSRQICFRPGWGVRTATLRPTNWRTNTSLSRPSVLRSADLSVLATKDLVDRLHGPVSLQLLNN